MVGGSGGAELDTSVHVEILRSSEYLERGGAAGRGKRRMDRTWSGLERGKKETNVT